MQDGYISSLQRFFGYLLEVGTIG